LDRITQDHGKVVGPANNLNFAHSAVSVQNDKTGKIHDLRISRLQLE
jgi:hypothetical protein